MLDDSTRTLTETREGRQQEGRQQEGRSVQLHAFRSYWESMRKGHVVPRRSDIDPRRIDALLPNAFIAERIAPGVTRLRIAGQHLSELMGMEVRGMPLSSFIAPAARDDFALRLVDLFEAPAALRMDLRSRAGVGRPDMTGTLILLPLRSDLGDVSRALGCFVTSGQIGRPSRRFEIVAARMEALSGAATTPLRALHGGAAMQDSTVLRCRTHLRVMK